MEPCVTCPYFTSLYSRQPRVWDTRGKYLKIIQQKSGSYCFASPHLKGQKPKLYSPLLTKQFCNIPVHQLPTASIALLHFACLLPVFSPQSELQKDAKCYFKSEDAIKAKVQMRKKTDKRTVQIVLSHFLRRLVPNVRPTKE